MTLRRLVAMPVGSNSPVFDQLGGEHGLTPIVEMDDENGNIYVGGILVSKGFGDLPIYASNADALAANALPGTLYRTGDDPLDYVCVVHSQGA